MCFWTFDPQGSGSGKQTRGATTKTYIGVVPVVLIFAANLQRQRQKAYLIPVINILFN